ncbi:MULTISPECIES: TonB-dependent copper receptor [unclassified Acinetobacter]|uniref:TonB-dependent copper receptor n=1 Tax=unclassified Acinetobacter TaxID=196816 RepID=UPI002934A0BC|nr:MULTISPECIES: TonB-dependent copper receptor [unclassified Acinetobacter]WOE30709.1 TonB-dependent copper receptor [Acinetobacter sp. SAAs470]WOE38902.1 TonB-dependent copper receptor [Acinetobacter sp. SAAs474]
MLQPKFLLQPLAAAICVVYSTTILATPTQLKPTIDSSEVETLAPIVVTAQHGNDANGLIVRADPKQPTQPIPASDGADYLQSIVGFNAVQSGAGTNGDVTFRGMFGSRIKILTDGSENLGACPSRMDAPTSYISPESYDRVSVIKGPQTVQYANTGSAATVLFERQPEQLNSEKMYRGQASVLFGSFGRLDHNLETAIGDETKYIRLNASRSVADSYQDGAGNTVPSDWKRWNADLALGWTPDEDTWLELTGGKADGEAVYAGRAMDGSQFARKSLGLRFEKKNISEVIKKVEGQVNYSFNDHVMDNYSLRTVPKTHDMQTHQMVDNPSSMQVTRRTLNTRLALTSAWNATELITGVDSQHNKHAGGMRSKMMNMPLTADMKYQSYGAFAELSQQFSDQNKVVTGIRLDHVEVNGLKTGLKRTENLPSAFIRLENSHPERNDVKTYIGLGYVERMPDYWELFKTDYQGVGANTFSQLKTEKTLQLDLGYQHQHGALSSWVSAYAGLVKDYILMIYPNTQNNMHGHSMSNNSGKNNTVDSRNVDATIAGAEAGVAYQFSDHIQADVSAMYAWGENTTDHTPLPQIAPLEGRFNLRYIQDKYNLGLLWRVVDRQNRISLNEGNIVGYDMGKSAGFATLALNGTYHIKQGIDLSVGIDNLLNKNYAEHLNKAGNSGFGFASNEQFNNIGRNYWARMSMKF